MDIFQTGDSWLCRIFRNLHVWICQQWRRSEFSVRIEKPRRTLRWFFVQKWGNKIIFYFVSYGPKWLGFDFKKIKVRHRFCSHNVRGMSSKYRLLSTSLPLFSKYPRHLTCRARSNLHAIFWYKSWRKNFKSICKRSWPGFNPN